VVDRGALGHAKKEYSRGHEFGAMTSLAFQNKMAANCNMQEVQTR